MFPSTHDIIDISPFKEACFAVMHNLLISGNNLLITTKPKVTLIQEIIEQFEDYKEQMQFRFTITSNNNKLLDFWEPNAPSFEARLDSLKYAFHRRWRTSVSIEPFLDYEPENLVGIVAPLVTESIWLGRMNYIRRDNLTEEERFYYADIRRNYVTSHLLRILDTLKNYPRIRLKDSIRRQLSSNGSWPSPSAFNESQRGLGHSEGFAFL